MRCTSAARCGQHPRVDSLLLVIANKEESNPVLPTGHAFAASIKSSDVVQKEIESYSLVPELLVLVSSMKSSTVIWENRLQIVITALLVVKLGAQHANISERAPKSFCVARCNTITRPQQLDTPITSYHNILRNYAEE